MNEGRELKAIISQDAPNKLKDKAGGCTLESLGESQTRSSFPISSLKDEESQGE